MGPLLHVLGEIGHVNCTCTCWPPPELLKVCSMGAAAPKICHCKLKLVKVGDFSLLNLKQWNCECKVKITLNNSDHPAALSSLSIGHILLKLLWFYNGDTSFRWTFKMKPHLLLIVLTAIIKVCNYRLSNIYDHLLTNKF